MNLLFSTVLDCKFSLIMFRLKEGHDLASVLIESFRPFEREPALKNALSNDPNIPSFIHRLIFFCHFIVYQKIQKYIRYQNQWIRVLKPQVIANNGSLT